MTNIKRFQFQYWRIFNFLIKFIGYVFALSGLYGLLLLIVSKFDPELSDFAETSTNSFNVPEGMGSIFIIVYLFILVVGILIIRAKPYFPERQ